MHVPADPIPTPYTYYPLDDNRQSIRLFRIRSSTGLLELELRAFCLESPECPPFASLSYMWGDQYKSKRISIDQRSAYITENAFLFLDTLRQHQARRVEKGHQGLPRRYTIYASDLDHRGWLWRYPFYASDLRRTSTSSGDYLEDYLEWVWMDSICINQSDPNERNHQVGLMQKIYGLADHVFFHIGAGWTERAQSKLDGQSDKKSRSLSLPEVTYVINLSEYANRLWIVQELVLGNRVSFVTSDDFIPFPELENSVDPGLGTLVGNIGKARELWHNDATADRRWRGRKLATLLEEYRNYECKENVDRVYGLLGICSEAIPIDYTLSPRELMLKILGHLIPKERDQFLGSYWISSLIKSLSPALSYALTEDDYVALSRQLKSDGGLSASADDGKSWWYCEDDHLLAKILTFPLIQLDWI